MSSDDSSLSSVSQRSDQIAGCLVGLAVGDALGAPLEFLSRREVRKRYPEGLRDMIDSRLWKKGKYTDDTQMALLIAESLLQRKGFLASDLARRFQTRARTAKDVGIQTRAVVNMAGYTHNPDGCSSRYHADHPNSSAGNGALMRCAPVALFPALPFSREVERLYGLRRALAIYRMVFGQNRQEDLITYLLAQIPEAKKDEIVADLQIDLSPANRIQRGQDHSGLQEIDRELANSGDSA